MAKMERTSQLGMQFPMYKYRHLVVYFLDFLTRQLVHRQLYRYK